MTHELFVQGLLKFGLVEMVSGSEHPDWPVTVHLKAQTTAGAREQ